MSTFETVGAVLVLVEKHKGRRIVAAASLALGCFIVWQLVRAIRANLVASDAGWTEYLPVVAMFGGLALVFIVPGLLFVSSRRSVYIDLAQRFEKWRNA